MNLHLREQLLTALRGGRPDQIPFTIYQWLVPEGPDGARLQTEFGLTSIGSVNLYRTSESTDVTVCREESGHGADRRTMLKVITPAGDLREVTAYDPSYGSPWIQEHLIKTPDDYRAMIEWLRHTAVEPDYDAWRKADLAMGEAGIVLGMIQPVPLAWMWVQLMGAERWAEDLMLESEHFHELHSEIMRLYKRQIDIAAASPAKVIWLPDNVTGTMVSPSVFERYLTPAYAYACSVLRQTGKLTFAHYDGANRPLAGCLAATDIDVIEAFTPPPMGDMTVAEARTAWPTKALSLNLPGNLFRAPEAEIAEWVRRYVTEAGDGNGFVVGCTEDFPVVEFGRVFTAVGQALRGHR